MQKGWIKKGILLLIILAIFVAPVSLNIKINDKHLAVGMEINKVFAQTDPINITANSTAYKDYVVIGALIKNLPEIFDIIVRIYDKKPNISDPPEIKEFGGFIESKEKKEELNLEEVMSQSDPKKIESLKFSLSFKNLKDNTDYWVLIGVISHKDEKTTIAYKPIPFKTNTDGQGNTIIDDEPNTKIGTPKVESDFGCSIIPFKIGGCILAGLDFVWQASALIGRLAGHFLDFFVYYATNSSSYSNIFVEKAWSAVRDVANIFFIVALLYVAIKTILSLNVTDNKKLIGYVIIIALIINFSLFTTKVVIDGSNILAKIFYNNIVSKDATTTNADGTLKDSEAGTEGQKSISVGLIRLFNPQNIVMEAYKNVNLGLGYAIFIILLLIAITLYTAYIFFSVAILFVARVISLWISMIFSPLAFAS
ncbi:hypothetical protein COX93_02795, partial [Candidatus Nomurabacteria bacterium CG_4_10_14_0_2_um_filter_30_12]